MATVEEGKSTQMARTGDAHPAKEGSIGLTAGAQGKNWTVLIRATGPYAAIGAAAGAATVLVQWTGLATPGALVLFSIAVFGLGAMINAAMNRAHVETLIKQNDHLREEVSRMAESRKRLEE